MTDLAETLEIAEHESERCVDEDRNNVIYVDGWCDESLCKTVNAEILVTLECLFSYSSPFRVVTPAGSCPTPPIMLESW
jgi:hypothetical protein